MTEPFGFELKGIITDKKKAEEVLELLKESFDFDNIWDDISKTPEKELCLQLGGNGEMSFCTAEEFTEWIKENITPLLKKPCRVGFEHDGDDISFYIGKSKNKLESSRTFIDIKAEIKLLNKKDLKNLVKLCEARLSKCK